MSDTFNVYCDENGHLEHDQQRVMVLGAVWCLLEKTREIARGIREIKLKRHPLLEGKEATFWHLISSGPLEQERLPDLRRCERIRG